MGLDRIFTEAERSALGDDDPEIAVVGVTIDATTGAQLRLALHLADDTILRVRMPADQLLTALGLVLLDLAGERRANGDV